MLYPCPQDVELQKLGTDWWKALMKVKRGAGGDARGESDYESSEGDESEEDADLSEALYLDHPFRENTSSQTGEEHNAKVHTLKGDD